MDIANQSTFSSLLGLLSTHYSSSSGVVDVVPIREALGLPFVDFADQVGAVTEEFSRGYGFLVDRLNRAALAISDNVSEGNGRFTKADRKNFFINARGSVQECVPLLELARRHKLIDEPVLN